jgi:molecular chaperone GrpE
MSDTREQAAQPEQAVQQSPGASASGDRSSERPPGIGNASGPQAGGGRPGNGASGPKSGASTGPSPGGPVVSGKDASNAAGELAEIEGDLDELVKVGAQRDEYLALAQRTQADFENYRKRMARESALAHERGVAKLVKELLPALDNLDRALSEAGSAAAGTGHEDPLLKGVRLVREQLMAALARVGVESYSPVGERFDPAFHEAMVQQPVPGAASGTVAEVYQPGYRLGEDIIRPARVVVAA